MENYEIDNLDRKILRVLMKDARTPFTDIAKDLIVSPGTIHQRVAKMEEKGILQGSKFEIDYVKLGLSVCVLLGIHLKNAKDCSRVIEQLKELKEVTEVYYTTGTYALIIKVLTSSIQDYHHFLINQLQAIKEIQATESFICLDTPINRPRSL